MMVAMKTLIAIIILAMTAAAHAGDTSRIPWKVTPNKVYRLAGEYTPPRCIQTEYKSVKESYRELVGTFEPHGRAKVILPLRTMKNGMTTYSAMYKRLNNEWVLIQEMDSLDFCRAIIARRNRM